MDKQERPVLPSLAGDPTGKIQEEKNATITPRPGADISHIVSQVKKEEERLKRVRTSSLHRSVRMNRYALAGHCSHRSSPSSNQSQSHLSPYNKHFSTLHIYQVIAFSQNLQFVFEQNEDEYTLNYYLRDLYPSQLVSA